MNPDKISQLIFFATVLFAFVSWGVLASRSIWPELRRKPRIDALRPLLILHSFRFIGLSFLVPGVVSPDLPAAFSRAAAFGDFIAALLALVALFLLQRKAGLAAVWLFNLWGTGDLLFAFFVGNRSGLKAGQLEAMYFIPTIFVPLALITHGMIFRILLGRTNERAMQVHAGS
ncbi:MAG: hypothetical protein VST70_00800 [Nitrospirota bacterium]|nr:hypothetical protein [Nitrospirota bacterium]